MKWAWKKADLLIAYRIMWNWKMLLIRYNVHFVKRFFFCWSIREFGVCMPMCANVCWVNVFLLTCVWAVPLEHSVPINVVAACFLSIRPTFVLRILLVQLLFALRNGLERDQIHIHFVMVLICSLCVYLILFQKKEKEWNGQYIYLKKKKQYEL